MNTKDQGPVVLVVMDGVGLSDRVDGNAVKAAHLETLTSIMTTYPMAKLGASGHYVGIPDGDMGNSEVGHNAIGAGQIIAQGTKLVDEAIIGGKAFTEPTWRNAIKNVNEYHSTLHFMGILSDGNVHSNITHLEAMVAQAHKEGVTRVRFHILVDGRDVPPQSEPKYIKQLEDFIKSLGAPDYKIASGGGRMVITADRYENDWPMVELGWRTAVLGEGRKFNSATEAVETFRKEDPDLQDQYMPPFVITESRPQQTDRTEPANGQPIGTINDHDSVIYLDFRADRALEISMAFTYDDFPYFDRVRRPHVYYAGMTEYNSDTHVPALTIVHPINIEHPLPQYLAKLGIRQYAISETVKFGHITYYLNGNSYDPPTGETDIEIPSYTEPFNTRPWMKSAEITDQLLAALDSNQYQFLRVNYPGGDMVGHFAEMEPTITALEAVDISLKRIIDKVHQLGGIVIVTADHGNAEELLDEKGGPKTAHTTNPVPCIFCTGPQVPVQQNPQSNTIISHQTEKVNTTTPKTFTYRDKTFALATGDFGLANLAGTISLLLGLDPDPSWLPSIIKPVDRSVYN